MLACLQALLQQNQVEDSLDEFGMAQLINRSAGRRVHVVQIHFLRGQGISFDCFEDVAMECLSFHDFHRLKLLPK